MRPSCATGPSSAAGKAATTVRQLLSHQSGAIGVPGADELLSWDGSGWSDTVAIAAGVAGGEPAWEPGTRHGYHGVTFGWLVGELVRRISGTEPGVVLRRRGGGTAGRGVLHRDPRRRARLGGHGHGVPREAGQGRARCGPSTRSPSPGARCWPAPTAASSPTRTAGPGSPIHEHPGRPGGRDRRARAPPRRPGRWPGPTPPWPTGEELVSRASVERFRTEQVCGRDAVMGVPTRWAVGYSLEPPALVPGVPPMHGPNDGAFGHMGAGGQIGFADPVGPRRLRLRPQPPGEPGAPAHGRLPGGHAVLVPGGPGKGAPVYAAEHAAEHPDHPAIIMAPSGRTLTFAEYEAGANQVAHVLRETGLRKGDHMAIFMENDPAMLLAEAGAERTGLYFTPVNSYLSAEEVAYVVNDSRSRVVVTSTAKAEVAAQLPALCPDVERLIMVDTTDSGARRRRLRVVGRRGRRATDGPCRRTSSWARP